MAAPENNHDGLLEALKQLHSVHRAFSSNDNWTILDDEARKLAEDAIAEAEGGGRDEMSKHTMDLASIQHRKAVAKRDAALGEAFEASLDSGSVFAVYHREGEYWVGPDSEWRANLTGGWMVIATVNV